MFNNIKYKVDDEIHEPIILKSSDLRSSSERVGSEGCSDQLNNLNDNYKVFTDYIKLYRVKSTLKRILYIPQLIITTIKFINNI